MGVMLALLVVGIWWSATGIILLLARRPRRTYAVTLSAATAVLAGATVLLRWSSEQLTIMGSCLAFGATILIWAWLEMSFLFGALTGPRQTACEAHCRGGRHLRHAIEAILYHKFATIGAGLLVVALTWHAPNQTGLWTFAILFGMRVSAKLNLFLGVPNTGETMLPAHLKYLGAFFRRSACNVLYPFSVAGALLLSVLLIGAACNLPDWSYQSAELTMLATLAVMGMFEHWMLMLPMRADAPWGVLRSTPPLRTGPGPVS